MQSSASSAGSPQVLQDMLYQLVVERHDEISQALFSASLIADVLPRLWERDPEEGRVRLYELRDLTRGALADISSLMNELQSPRTHMVNKEEAHDQGRTASEKED